MLFAILHKNKEGNLSNIYQSAPNFVKMYMTMRAWMSSIMGLIGPRQHELFVCQ